MDGITNRVPPYSEENERGLLGAILSDPIRVMAICQKQGIDTEAFYVPAHRWLWRAMAWLHENGKAIDALTVSDALAKHNKLDEVGGHGIIDKCVLDATTAHAEHYASEIMQQWLARQCIEVSRETETLVSDRENDPRDVLAGQVHKLSALCQQRTISQAKTEVWTRVRESAHAAREGRAIGIPAPWPKFSDYTGGARLGSTTLIVGRSKTRKSYLAHQWGIHAAVRHDPPIPGAYYPLEDGQDMAMLRAACVLCQLNPHMYERGRKSKRDSWEDVDTAMDAAAAQIIASPYDIRKGRGMTLPEWRMDIARGVAEHGWKFVVLDAFKDIGDTHGDYREEAALAKWCHDVADEFGLALIIVQHVKKNRTQNRKKDDKHWERLIKEDSRGASQITDGARMIVALQCQIKRDINGYNQYVHYVLDCIDNNYGETAAVSLDLDRQTGLFTENLSRLPFSDWTYSNDAVDMDEEQYWEK